MSIDVTIRAFQAGDVDPVLEIYPAAFPDENLVPLVAALADCDDVHAFVAVKEDRIIGHGAFTICALENGDQQCALLGPLAVHPDFARRGVGGALVRVGIDAMSARGAAAVMVLGDPAYYSRFGFKPERAVMTPYPLREEWADAWQSVWRSDDQRPQSDMLVVPAPWRDQALWR